MKGVYVDNLTEVAVTSKVEAYKVFLKGLSLKHVQSTHKNRESSRSHTLFQVKMVDVLTSKVLAKFSLVDLAGSERLDDCENI